MSDMGNTGKWGHELAAILAAFRMSRAALNDLPNKTALEIVDMGIARLEALHSEIKTWEKVKCGDDEI